MNIYRISQDINKDYDTFDAAIVVAESEEQAASIHPNLRGDDAVAIFVENPQWPCPWNMSFDWVKHPSQVKVELIASDVDLPMSVLLASFNAG